MKIFYINEIVSIKKITNKYRNEQEVYNILFLF